MTLGFRSHTVPFLFQMTKTIKCQKKKISPIYLNANSNKTKNKKKTTKGILYPDTQTGFTSVRQSTHMHHMGLSLTEWVVWV